MKPLSSTIRNSRKRFSIWFSTDRMKTADGVWMESPLIWKRPIRWFHWFIGWNLAKIALRLKVSSLWLKPSSFSRIVVMRMAIISGLENSSIHPSILTRWPFFALNIHWINSGPYWENWALLISVPTPPTDIINF